MCFAVSYDCTISCVNGYLNVTKIKQGIVTSDGITNTCQITCGAAQESADWGTTHNIPLQDPGFLVPYLPTLPDPNAPVPLIWFLGVLVVMAIILIFILKDKL